MEYRNKNISLNLEAASGAISNKPASTHLARGIDIQCLAKKVYQA
jgi:hypothetical protein